MSSGGASAEVEVTWEDQRHINMFGRLNNRVHELQDDLLRKKEELLHVEDASNELILLDDDVPARYKMGEIFIEVPKDQAEQLLTQNQTQLEEEMDAIQDEIDKIKRTLAELKVKLYGKFGSAINLDE